LSMLLFIVFCPIVAAILIIAGAPARLTALIAAILNLIAVGLILSGFDRAGAGFQFVTSVLIVADWQIHFALGIDGLSLTLILLATIVTLAAVWFTGKIDQYESAFYACLLLISGGALGACASLDLFFFYAFHEL